MAKPWSQMSDRERAGRGTAQWKRTREAVLTASDICWMCGRPGADTVDHIVPLSHGGDPLDLRNLRPAHGKRQAWGCPGNYGRRTRHMKPMVSSREW